MTSSTVAAMRRANRMLRPARLTKATRSVQKAMTGFMLDTSLIALKPKKAKPHKTAAPKAGRSLGAALIELSAAQWGRDGGTAKPAVKPRVPAGAQYLTRTHRSASGSRGYKLYIPACHARRPKGLILMLHGCNQSPDDFATGTHMNALAEKHGLVVAYPAQTGGENSSHCWNWFKPGDQRRGRGEPALLASLTRKLMREFGLGREGVFVAGLSAGGAMASILADVYPDVYSAAGVHSGLARGAAHNVMSAMSAMRRGGVQTDMAPVIATPSGPVRRIIFQGEADNTVNPANAASLVIAALGGDTAPTKVGRRSVRGRAYDRSDFAGPDGAVLVELWMIEGAGHAWSGGSARGSYTDSKGPDASAQMVRFFLTKPA
ncbi:MAG: alpha/beta hydrolase family esterase [Pararhodobacter sp.]